ncbi:MAG: hypothetical protein LBU91_04800, partial [Bacteroidales bacterium]|nr:hypothetical protein [Bacteroidales bacterium]
MKRVSLSILLAVCFFGVFGQPKPVYVNVGASGSGDSWSDPAGLQQAMEIAKDGLRDVWVQMGTYKLTKTLVVPDGIRVYGDFRGNETFSDFNGEADFSERYQDLRLTVLDGQGLCRVVYLNNNAVLDGFTVRNGVAAGVSTSLNDHGYDGGGIWMGTNASVIHCHVVDNRALHNGGGIYADGSGTILNSLIARNRAGWDGAAIYGTTLEVRSNTVVDNTMMDCESTTNTTYAPICAGQSITLTVDDAGTYLWNTGATSASITTPVLTKDTTFTVVVTKADGCLLELSFSITVKPLPSLTITGVPNPTNPGATATFTAEGTPSGGTYQWDDALATTGPVLTQVMGETGDLQATCTYTLNGCSVEEIYTITNTKCTPATAPTALTVDDAEVCMGDSTVLRLEGGNRYSGKWVLYSGGCGEGTPLAESNLNADVTFKIKPTVNTTYYVRGEGCGEQTSCVSVLVEIAPLPDAIMPIAPEVCVGSEITLTNTTPGGTWSVDGELRITNYELGEVTVTGVSAGVGTVYYTLPTSCQQSIVVDVKALPFDIEGDTNLCEGETRVFSSVTVGGKWSSSNTEVAIVDVNSGEVTALKN